MLFEFKLKNKGLGELRPTNNEIESTEDTDNTTDESSIFDSITNNSISVISEDNEEKKTFSRSISCYTTPPLLNEKLNHQVFEKQPTRDIVKKKSWLGRPISVSLKKREDLYKKNKTHYYTEDYEYNSMSNENRRNEFCQNVANYKDVAEQPMISENKEINTSCSDSLEEGSLASTSATFHSEEAPDISCSTIESDNKKDWDSRQKHGIDQNTLRNRLSFLQPISLSLKIKIYISESNKFEEEVVVALKVQKEQLQGINELIDVIIIKLASQCSAIKRQNVKLYLFFKKESIRPIPLPMTSSDTLNDSTLNLIMDYLSGRDKIYIRAVV